MTAIFASGLLLAGSIASAQEGIVTRAAFDIGSGQCKVTAADVDSVNDRICKIWLQTDKKVETRKDLAESLNQNLSQKIERELIDTILELKEKVDRVCSPTVQSSSFAHLCASDYGNLRN